MTTPTVTEIRQSGNPVGERVELARYTITAGTRVLVGQRVDGTVRVSAIPSTAAAGPCWSSAASSRTATPPWSRW